MQLKPTIYKNSMICVIKRNSKFILLTAFFLFFVILNAFSVLPDIINQFTKIWTDNVDPLLGTGTFIVACAVWYGEKRENWKESLPKKLTVFFMYKKPSHPDTAPREVMRCECAELASEADMRALAQQIGNQMNDNVYLKFNAAKLKPHGGDIKKDEHQKIFREFFITIEVRELPSTVVSIQKNELLLWKHPFDEQKVVSIDNVNQYLTP
ncbi:MAG: hypothetical protein L3J26_08620 [Candidatus Polarisedimenticolaceae bacterium]|nr:hypothetical protein [Candidatus Polarisedimenticolaceae bacterium]